MNDEIKEILNKLKSLVYDDYCLEFSVDYIERKEEKLLLDYITNLQKEIDRLNNMLNNADNKNLLLIEEINEKQDIIEKAIEYVNTWVCDEYSIAIQDPNDECFCSTEPNAVDNLLKILQNGSDENE